jgi:hypothetical protein
MFKKYIFFVTLITNILPIVTQISSKNTMEKFIDHLLDKSSYDRRIRPFFKENKPTIIKMNMNINSISGISEVNMVTYLHSIYKKFQ